MTMEPKLELVEAPSGDVVTVEELADFLGASSTDPLLASVLAAATERCEQFCGLALLSQTWKQFYDLQAKPDMWWDGVREMAISELYCLPASLALARRPVVSITSIKFYAQDDTSVTAEEASYYLSKSSVPVTVSLRSGYTWPAVDYRVRDAVEVLFTAGFGEADDVPDSLKHGIKSLAAYMYEHRGQCEIGDATAKSGASNFWRSYKRVTV